MRLNGRRGRLLSAALSSLIVATAIPAIASPATAAPVYTLAATGAVRISVSATMTLSASEAMPVGDYCVSVDAGSGYASTASSQAAAAGTTQLTFSIAVAGVTPGLANFTAYAVGSPGACPTTTPVGTTALAQLANYVAGPPINVALSPPTSLAAVSTPTTMSWVVRDLNGQPTRLAGIETVDVSSTTSSTVRFNGSVQTAIVLNSSSAAQFTVQNSVAESANITAALNVGIVPTPKDTVTLLTGSAGTGLTVTPSTTATPLGGTTTFTIIARSDNTPRVGVSIYASISGRNTRPQTLIGTTGTDGTLMWSFKDTNTTNSTILQDTVTFTDAVAFQVAQVTYEVNLIVTPPSATTVPGGTTTFHITAAGASGVLLAGIPIYASVNGRNPRALTLIGVTTTSGAITWSLTDTNPTGVILEDTVTFTSSTTTTSATTATILYLDNFMAVLPANAITPLGGSTTFNVSVRSPDGTAAVGTPVIVSSVGRNTFASHSAGVTDGNGRITWVQQDTGTGSAGALADQLTFVAGNRSVRATVTYPTVSVTSPVNGSRLSTGGLFGVSATTTGVPAGTEAYLTLNGNATAVSEVQPNGAVRFDGTAVGGGRWIPAQAGQYGVRLCGGACGDPLGTTSPFQLSLIPFGITSGGRRSDGRLGFTVAVGNFSSGTPIELTRNGVTVASGRVRSPGLSISIVAPYRPGNYQVRVSTPQGIAYGDHAGVVWIP